MPTTGAPSFLAMPDGSTAGFGGVSTDGRSPFRRREGLRSGEALSTTIRQPRRTCRGPARSRRRARSAAIFGYACHVVRARSGSASGRLARLSPSRGIEFAGDQPLDFENVFLIGGVTNETAYAGFARASGAADAMDIILGMGSDIEIEPFMAYVWNIEAARRDIRADDKVHDVRRS